MAGAVDVCEGSGLGAAVEVDVTVGICTIAVTVSMFIGVGAGAVAVTSEFGTGGAQNDKTSVLILTRKSSLFFISTSMYKSP
jgi:hypothetical protein